MVYIVYDGLTYDNKCYKWSFKISELFIDHNSNENFNYIQILMSLATIDSFVCRKNR